MELMSSLLFCVLVAHLPQAFGKSNPDPDLPVKYTSSKEIHQMPMQKKVLLNINGPPLVNMVSDLQTVFMDVACSKCINCMERAVKAHITHYHSLKNTPSIEELNNHVLQHKTTFRQKRDADTATAEKIAIKVKRTKAKKNKSIIVTKYNVDGEVFALKVRETIASRNGDSHNDTQVSTCQIFRVKKSFPCDTAEGESLLTIARRKVNKKNKKAKVANKTEVTTSQKPMTNFLAPAFRKRQVDNSQVPDNFMTSLEEFY